MTVTKLASDHQRMWLIFIKLLVLDREKRWPNKPKPTYRFHIDEALTWAVCVLGPPGEKTFAAQLLLPYSHLARSRRE